MKSGLPVAVTDDCNVRLPFAVVTLLFAAIAFFACWLPAWRASRLDPNAVLRIE